MAKVELGDRVRDRITGLEGIAVGATDWLYACRRIVVQPELKKDGKPAETFCVDEPQLEVLKRGVIVPPRAAVAKRRAGGRAAVAPPPRKTGGLRPDPGRREDPKPR